ncbi:MAG TPA: transcription elongation factor GreA [Acidimicrobiia bacterium]|nr:transcription elongation factor GreA [Acidimicrobiia bacterium]
METAHLSQQAFDRLQEELEERSGKRRKEISAAIERAREHGDLRENADYDAAKNEQGHNEARIRQLEAMLKTAVVVESTVGDVVAPGTIVEIKMDGDDAPTSYLVGSIEERHDTLEVLSSSSPLGQALLGHGPGDVVSYDGPRRTFRVEIVSIRAGI